MFHNEREHMNTFNQIQTLHGQVRINTNTNANANGCGQDNKSDNNEAGIGRVGQQQ